MQANFAIAPFLEIEIHSKRLCRIFLFTRKALAMLHSFGKKSEKKKYRRNISDRVRERGLSYDKHLVLKIFFQFVFQEIIKR